VVINCGKRRIVPYTYGWKIEIKKVYGEDSKSAGDEYWGEDRPAYPVTLTQAILEVYDRELKEAADEIDLRELRSVLDAVEGRVKGYLSEAVKEVTER